MFVSLQVCIRTSSTHILAYIPCHNVVPVWQIKCITWQRLRKRRRPIVMLLPVTCSPSLIVWHKQHNQKMNSCFIYLKIPLLKASFIVLTKLESWVILRCNVALASNIEASRTQLSALSGWLWTNRWTDFNKCFLWLVGNARELTASILDASYAEI